MTSLVIGTSTPSVLYYIVSCIVMDVFVYPTAFTWPVVHDVPHL